MRNHLLKKVGISVMILTLTSCAIRKDYERPQVVEERLFRTDNISTDSLSTAAVSWREIFTDTILQQHIEKALENNLDIRIALANIQSAQAYLKQSKFLLLPSVSSSIGYTGTTSAAQGNRSYQDSWDLSGMASWEADIWGKLDAQKKATYATYLASVSGHQAVQSEVVATIATAYYQLMMFDKQKKILEETIQLRKESLETTKALKAGGITTEVAVQQTEALLYNAQSQLIMVNNSIWGLENSMSVLMGGNPHEIQRNTLDNLFFPVRFNQGYAMSLLENRPDVKRAELELINAFELTNVAHANFYPSLNLTARAGISSGDIEKWFSAQSLFASIMAGLTQPIFNRGQIRTQYEVSLINQEKALIEFKKTLLNAGKEVSDAMHYYQEQDAFISLKSKEMEASQKATEYSKDLFNSGMASYLEVISSEVTRLNAELAVANAQFMKMQYGITLYKALGGGWR